MQLSNYDLVPVAHMADGMRRYIEDGIRPGNFLTALLCNDLMDAARRADEMNHRYLADWAKWVYNYAPRGCFGSKKRFEAWIDMKDIMAKSIYRPRERTEISAK